MVYLDILFIFNWFIDYLILSLVQQDYFPGIRKRKVAAGAFFAAGSYLCWFCQIGKVPRILLNLEAMFFFILILLWSFSIREVWLLCKTSGLVFLYTFLMGGFCHVLLNICSEEMGIYKGRWMVPPGCTFLFIVIRYAGKRIKKDIKRRSECTYEVEIRRKNHVVFLRGMYDSGNMLTSRWTGNGICILTLKAVQGLLDEQEKKTISFLVRQKSIPWKAMTDHLWSEIYPITYSSVGKKDGWMPGISADHIIVKKHGEVLADRKGLLGITAQQILKDGAADLLLPADIFDT